MGEDKMIFISDEENDLIELGYVIGFFEGEGCFGVTSANGYVNCRIVQQDKTPLIKIKKILAKRNINSYLSLQKKPKKIWILIIRHNDVYTFIKLLEGFLGEKKEAERQIIEKLLLFRLKYGTNKFPTGKQIGYLQYYKSIWHNLVTEYKQLKAKYKGRV